jgi:hypothetical protein
MEATEDPHPKGPLVCPRHAVTHKGTTVAGSRTRNTWRGTKAVLCGLARRFMPRLYRGVGQPPVGDPT